MIRSDIEALDVKNQESVLSLIFNKMVGEACESNQFSDLPEEALQQLDEDTLEKLEEVRCSFKAGNKGSLWSFGAWLFFAGSPVEAIRIDDCHKFRVIWNKDTLR